MASNNCKKAVRCRSCRHAHLIRYGSNPVLAECTKKPQPLNPRFPFAVDVACTLKNCALYVWQDESSKEVEVRERRS